uniref:Uncharacterized protein n=1 Tax=Anopheles minimus TaxID=112268 RepID=A0A182WQ08_9DIPT
MRMLHSASVSSKRTIHNQCVIRLSVLARIRNNSVTLLGTYNKSSSRGLVSHRYWLLRWKSSNSSSTATRQELC